MASNMDPSKIIRSGPMDLSNVKVKVTPLYFHQLPEHLTDRVENIWNMLLVTYMERGLPFYNGSLYRLDRITDEEDIMILHLSLINFKDARIFSELAKSEDIQLTEKIFPQHLTVGALIKTSDNKYIFGKRNDNSKSDIIGGVLSSHEIVLEEGWHIREVLDIELKEEINVGVEYIADQTLLGIVRAGNFNIMFLFLTELGITSEQVKELFNEIGADEKLKRDGELSSLEIVEAGDIEIYLRGLWHDKHEALLEVSEQSIK